MKKKFGIGRLLLFFAAFAMAVIAAGKICHEKLILQKNWKKIEKNLTALCCLC